MQTDVCFLLVIKVVSDECHLVNSAYVMAETEQQLQLEETERSGSQCHRSVCQIWTWKASSEQRRQSGGRSLDCPHVKLSVHLLILS